MHRHCRNVKTGVIGCRKSADSFYNSDTGFVGFYVVSFKFSLTYQSTISVQVLRLPEVSILVMKTVFFHLMARISKGWLKSLCPSSPVFLGWCNNMEQTCVNPIEVFPK